MLAREDLQFPQEIREFLELIEKALQVSNQFQSQFPLLGDTVFDVSRRHAAATVENLVAAANSAIASAGLNCPLAQPPSSITTNLDTSTGNWRLQCGHSPQHCWTLSGTHIAC